MPVKENSNPSLSSTYAKLVVSGFALIAVLLLALTWQQARTIQELSKISLQLSAARDSKNASPDQDLIRSLSKALDQAVTYYGEERAERARLQAKIDALETGQTADSSSRLPANSPSP